jgi:hypothetical protein
MTLDLFEAYHRVQPPEEPVLNVQVKCINDSPHLLRGQQLVRDQTSLGHHIQHGARWRCFVQSPHLVVHACESHQARFISPVVTVTPPVAAYRCTIVGSVIAVSGVIKVTVLAQKLHYGQAAPSFCLLQALRVLKPLHHVSYARLTVLVVLTVDLRHSAYRCNIKAFLRFATITQ